MVPRRGDRLTVGAHTAFSGIRDIDPMDAVVPFQVEALDARGRAVMVGPMLDLMSGKTAEFARAWLEANAELAVAALIPMALGRDKKKADEALKPAVPDARVRAFLALMDSIQAVGGSTAGYTRP